MRNVHLRSRACTVVAAGSLIAAASLFTATSASATVTVSTNCNWLNGLMLFYNSNEGGASADVCDDLYDYTGWPVYNGSSLDTTHLVFSSYYNGSSSGAGVGVKNNAASVLNMTGTLDGTDFTVYYHSGYTGSAQSIPWTHGGTTANLIPALKNNNASQRAFAG